MSAERVHAVLDEAGIRYEVHEHPRAVDANRLAASEEVSGWEVAKPVMLAVDGQLTMAVVPAAVSVDLDKASTALDAREVRLATEDEFVGLFPDCDPGAEPPFGTVYDVPVIVDQRLRDRDRIVCRDGSHTTTITLPVADYLRVVDATVADVAAGNR